MSRVMLLMVKLRPLEVSALERHIGLLLTSGVLPDNLQEESKMGGYKGRRLWTFVIRGSGDLYISLPANPPLEHEAGRTTIWKAILDDEAVMAVKRIVQRVGCYVETITDEQTDGQRIEREKVLSVQSSDVSFETERCPECYFFDPLTVSRCGLRDWTMNIIGVSLKTKKARTDKDLCPSKCWG